MRMRRMKPNRKKMSCPRSNGAIRLNGCPNGCTIAAGCFSLAYVLVTVTMCVFASVMFLRVFNDVLAFITDNRAITISIDESDTTDDVAAKLKDAGLIKYDWLFSYVAKFEGTVAPYEPGEHTLNDNMNYMELLNEIEKKKTVRETVQITLSKDWISMRLLRCWKKTTSAMPMILSRKSVPVRITDLILKTKFRTAVTFFIRWKAIFSRIPTNFIPTLHRQTLSSDDGQLPE